MNTAAAIPAAAAEPKPPEAASADLEEIDWGDDDFDIDLNSVAENDSNTQEQDPKASDKKSIFYKPLRMHNRHYLTYQLITCHFLIHYTLNDFEFFLEVLCFECLLFVLGSYKMSRQKF